MRLVITADTHVPRRARDLPSQLWEAISGADVVVHAGDWTDAPIFERVKRATPLLVGVAGNNDVPELAARLPATARIELGGVRLVVVHETGPASGREGRCDRRYPDADVVVFGHSHIPWESTTAAGRRLLNPGSPTDRRRQPACSYMSAEIEGGRLTVLQVHLIDAHRSGRGPSDAPAAQ